MKKGFLGKAVVTLGLLGAFVGGNVLATIGTPEFNTTKLNMKLGSTQKISGIINVENIDYSKFENSNPSVVALQDKGTLKAVSTGISTLSYRYTDLKGEEKTIFCYVEVSKKDSTYSNITGTVTSKITITLDLGEYTTTLESSQGAIPSYPSVTKQGFVLEGWYKDKACTIKVATNERFAEDNILYAKWISAEEANRPVVAPSALYNDINNHWAKNEIESVSYLGLFNGVSERMFGPDKTMTRAMVITVLGRLDEVKLTGRKTEFKDVPSGSYYEEYVAWGVENGIVKGTTEDSFSPNKEITREEMAVMMANYVKYKKHDYKLNELYYSDADNISSWAIESVKILDNLKIMQGNANGTYMPKKVATRAEIAKVFFNYINYINT